MKYVDFTLNYAYTNPYYTIPLAVGNNCFVKEIARATLQTRDMSNSYVVKIVKNISEEFVCVCFVAVTLSIF